MTDNTAAGEARCRETIAAFVANLGRQFLGAGVRHHDGFDSDWNFDPYLRGHHHPRRVVVRADDRGAGRSTTQAFAAAPEWHRTAKQLNREPASREVIIRRVQTGPRERRG